MNGCLFADNLLLLAPNMNTLQAMVKECEVYGREHNLVFSTDPIPALSKTKCILFCGRPGKVSYPPPVMLDGKELPWVQEVTHVGHVLHQTLKWMQM